MKAEKTAQSVAENAIELIGDRMTDQIIEIAESIARSRKIKIDDQGEWIDSDKGQACVETAWKLVKKAIAKV